MEMILKNTDVLIKQDYEIVFNYNLVNRFIAYTDVTDTTIKGYITYIKQFIRYLLNKNIKQPTRADIKEYKEYLKNSKLKNGTKAQYFRAVKHFFKWLSSEGLYPNVADNIKGFKEQTDNTKKESLNEADVRRILASIDRTTEIGKRDYAMFLLIITGGLRINEISNINIEDIQVIKGEYVVYILGKGHTEKDTYIKLIKPVYEATKDYLQVKKNYKKTDPLFTSTSNRSLNKKITKQTISEIIKNRLRQAGYDTPKLTAHSLRHTSNTLLFKSGADLFKVQQHARHKDPKTTEIYLHVVDRENDTSEQDIYNQIFNTQDKDLTKELKIKLSELNKEQQEKVLKYIDKLRGCEM